MKWMRGRGAYQLCALGVLGGHALRVELAERALASLFVLSRPEQVLRQPAGENRCGLAGRGRERKKERKKREREGEGEVEKH